MVEQKRRKNASKDPSITLSGKIIKHSDGTTGFTFGEVEIKALPNTRLYTICHELKTEFPDLIMRRKITCWRSKILHYVVAVITFGGNRRYLNSFTTVIGQTIYWPESKWRAIQNCPHEQGANSIWKTLMHEREHLRDAARLGLFWFGLLYFCVYFPIGLAWYRAKFERKGYLKTLQCWYELDRTWALSAEAKKWWIGQFIGPNYGWAWPFRKMVTGWYDQELSRLKSQETLATKL
jgi:hypothetical protein